VMAVTSFTFGITLQPKRPARNMRQKKKTEPEGFQHEWLEETGPEDFHNEWRVREAQIGPP
jgi:hypothetical protein